MDVDRLIRAAPVEERFGPSLPQLLAPRIDRLPAIARRVGALVAALVVVVIVAIVLRGRDPAFSYAGRPAFHTSYSRALEREATPPGALLLLEQRSATGLVASFEVTPLALPRYGGEISGLLPVYAVGYARRLAAQVGPTFRLENWRSTRIINTPAYSFSYSRQLGNGRYFGRVVFITKDLSGDRHGLILSMLTSYAALKAATKPVIPTPDSVGTAGVLFEPLERLRFG